MNDICNSESTLNYSHWTETWFECISRFSSNQSFNVWSWWRSTCPFEHIYITGMCLIYCLMWRLIAINQWWMVKRHFNAVTGSFVYSFHRSFSHVWSPWACIIHSFHHSFSHVWSPWACNIHELHHSFIHVWSPWAYRSVTTTTDRDRQRQTETDKHGIGLGGRFGGEAPIK